MAEPTHIKNDDMHISIESFQLMLINEESEKPQKSVASFTVSLDPPVVIKRGVLIYPDGRVYLDG